MLWNSFLLIQIRQLDNLWPFIHAVLVMAVEHNQKNQANVYNEVSAQYQTTEGLKLIDLVCVKEGSRVLDLGCGTGRLTVVLADRVGSKGHVVGVDPDKERLKTAREKNSRANITYIEADGETFSEGQYDLVFSNYVLHWVKNKEPVFKRISENLHPGGKFAFTAVLDYDSLFWKAYELFEPEKLKLLRAQIFHEPTEKLEEMAARNGFDVTYKKVTTDEFTFPNADTFLRYLFASSGGQLDPKEVNKGLIETFRQKFSRLTAKVSAYPTAYFVLSKH